MFRRMILIIISAVMVCGWVHADLGGTVFKEDFTKYEIGDPLTDWGTSDVVVIKTSDDKTWVQAQTPGQHKIEKRLKMPNNFVLTFDVIDFRIDFDLLFINSEEDIHAIYFHHPKYSFQDTITKKLYFDTDKLHNVKVIKKNKTFKLLINDTFVLSSTPEAFGQINGIAFKFQPTNKIGNIEIKELILN